jgi:hypothetical protein
MRPRHVRTLNETDIFSIHVCISKSYTYTVYLTVVMLSFGKIVANRQKRGGRGSVVVKALCCKPEGRGFKS